MKWITPTLLKEYFNVSAISRSVCCDVENWEVTKCCEVDQPDACVEKPPAGCGCTRLAQGRSIITPTAAASGFDCRLAAPGPE